MEALIAAGADTTVKAQDGSSLLFLAVASARLPVVELAYSHDDDVTVVTGRGTTLMHRIASSRIGTSLTQDEVVDVVRFLASKGAALDDADGRGRTPIEIADYLPIDKAVNLLYDLIIESGNLPKKLPKDLQ
jgi:ankyrin repeat protein